MSGEKEQQKVKSEHKISESRQDDTSQDGKEKEAVKEAGIKRSISGTKRRRSEDELELHPTIDWEEEGEGGGREGEIKESDDRLTSRKHSRRSGERGSLHRNSGGEPKVSRTSSGDKEGEKKRGGRKGLVSAVEEKVDREDGDLVPAVKHTRGVKVYMFIERTHTYIYSVLMILVYIHVHCVCIVYIYILKNDN